jgi:transcriptional regulator with XRE-family HTH domain
MPSYRLNTARLFAAAAAAGDQSSYAVAKRTGLSQDTIGRLRKGTVSEPTVQTLFVLADAYQVPVADLVDRTPDAATAVSA